MMDQLKSRLSRIFWFSLAIVFLIESWLWDNVKQWLRALGRILGAEKIEPWLAGLVARLSPPFVLVLFAAPLATILPVKIFAWALLAHGQIFWGAVVVVAAKALALGVMSFLFDICREKLLEMPLFGRLYSLVLDLRAWATLFVKPYKDRARAILSQIRTRAFAFMGGDGSAFARRFARLRDFARTRRSL
jgi:hypothetical protein